MTHPLINILTQISHGTSPSGFSAAGVGTTVRRLLKDTLALWLLFVMIRRVFDGIILDDIGNTL